MRGGREKDGEEETEDEDEGEGKSLITPEQPDSPIIPSDHFLPSILFPSFRPIASMNR